MTLVKVAIRLAFSRRPEQRWRQVSVAAGALVGTLVALLALGLVHVAADARATIAARSPVWATTPAEATLWVSLRGLVLDGEQLPVVWLHPEPGHEDDLANVPPGLDALPEAGSAVLSPGLVAAGWSAADLGLAASDVGSGPDGTIGSDGLVSATDGWVYARPAAGRDLGEGGALLATIGYDGPGPRADLEAYPDIPGVARLGLMVAALLVAPAAVVVVSSSRSLSPARAARARTLYLLGIAPGRTRRLLGIETAAVALPGVLAAVAAWVGWLSHVTVLPLTGTVLLSGAMHVGAPAVAGVGLIVLVLLGVSGAVVRPDRASLRRRVRPVRPWTGVPLVVALTAMGGSQLVPVDSPARAVLLFAGLFLTFVALPMGLPVIAAHAGRALGARGTAARWLAGRRLQIGSWNLTRPAAVVGLLVFIGGAAFAVYARMTAPDPDAVADSPVAAVDVGWRDPRPGDVDTVRERLGDYLVLPTVADDQREPTATVPSCAAVTALAQRIGTPACAGDDLDPALIERFRALTHRLLVVDDGTSRLADDGVLVIDTSGVGAPDDLPRILMHRLAGDLPALNVTAVTASTPLTPDVGWLTACCLVAAILLAAALNREIGDRAIGALTADRSLGQLGLSAREIGAVERWSLLTPVVAAIPLGYLAAAAFALMGYELGYTADNLLRIAVVAGAAGLMALGTMLVAFRIGPRLAGSRADGTTGPTCGNDEGPGSEDPGPSCRWS